MPSVRLATLAILTARQFLAATAPRPLRAALDALDPSIADLLNAGALADVGPVAANLRALANLDPVKRARKLELAQRAVRAALGTL